MDMSWFERLLPLLERVPTARLALMRDIINAIVERRRMSEQVAHDDLESAMVHACRHRDHDASP